MVKVIGIDTQYIKKVTCRNCASILEYTDSEVITKRYRDYLGDTDYVKIIKCPNCKTDVTVG